MSSDEKKEQRSAGSGRRAKSAAATAELEESAGSPDAAVSESTAEASKPGASAEQPTTERPKSKRAKQDSGEAVFIATIEGLEPSAKDRLWSKILGQLGARGRDPKVKSHGIFTHLIDATFPDDPTLQAQFRERLERITPESHDRFLATVRGIQGQTNRPAAVRLSGVVDAFEKLF